MAVEKIIGVSSALYPANNSDIYFDDVGKLENSAIVILERPRCETDKNYRHFATYSIIQNEDGDILTYYRPSKNTESRIAGNMSIGIGGHVDATDFTESLRRTLIKATRREIQEELFTGMENDGIVANFLSNIEDIDPFADIHLLLDNSNEVGMRHIAVISRFVMSDELIRKFSSSIELIEPKFIPLSELVEGISSDEMKFENWSKFIIQNFLSLKGNRTPTACIYGERPFA